MTSRVRNAVDVLRRELPGALARHRPSAQTLYGVDVAYGRRSPVSRTAHVAHVVRKAIVAALDDRPSRPPMMVR